MEEISSEEEEEESFLEHDSNLPDDIFTPDIPSNSSVEPLGYKATSKRYDEDSSKSSINLSPKSYQNGYTTNKPQSTPSKKTITHVLPPFVSEISPTYKNLDNKNESNIPNVTDVPIADEVESPPLAGPNVMNVVLVAAECTPWSKTGTTTNFVLIY